MRAGTTALRSAVTRNSERIGDRERGADRKRRGPGVTRPAALPVLETGHRPVALALPMAGALDCGLVACEVALIGETRR